MSENKYFDANGNEFTPSSEDFELVNADKKIHDQKFDTKATTFAKDAFKRFCKNKSSVVAAIIIALLLLCSLFLPIIIPYNISNPMLEQSLLRPKLFEAGTGFWDGTETYYNIIYDKANEAPKGFEAHAVYKVLEHKKGQFINTPVEDAFGGYLKVVATQIKAADDPYQKAVTFENYTQFDVTADGEYKVLVSLVSMDELLGVHSDASKDISASSYAPYRISIVYGEKDNRQRIVVSESSNGLTDGWNNTTYSDYNIDLSSYVSTYGTDGVLKNVSLLVELLPSTSDERYILIDEIILEANDTVSDETRELLSTITFSNRLDDDNEIIYEHDANDVCLYAVDPSGRFPVGYWRTTGRRDLYRATIEYISFIYDPYEAALGNKYMEVGGTDLARYVEKGWISVDYTVSSWEAQFDEAGNITNMDSCPVQILDKENCPINVVYDFSTEEFLGETVYKINGYVSYYKYLGYKTMPKYLLGTTVDGKDIVKLAFKSLRTSLLLAIFVSAFCLAFGLCWGAISGYFGGNVDILMERFTDILSGIPYIVVMTLAILHLGNNIFTFAMALCLTSWIGTASRTRTQFYRFKGREYILASRTLGASDKRLIFRHILPNALGTIVTSSVLMIPSVIYSESTLAYLNLGLKGVESFGVLLSDNQQYLGTYPALIVFPSIIISLLMISFNLFGNGLRDALNPSLKGSE